MPNAFYFSGLFQPAVGNMIARSGNLLWDREKIISSETVADLEARILEHLSESEQLEGNIVIVTLHWQLLSDEKNLGESAAECLAADAAFGDSG